MKQNGMRERKGRISRYGRRMLAVLLSAGMLLTETLPVFGTENTEETARPHQLYCTVLGDSIAKGYTCDKSWMENYGSLAAKEIAYSEGCRYIYHNYARTGLDTAGLNEKYLSKQDVQTNLSKADVIFITIGSNDLLNECKRVVQEILKTDTKFKSADEALASLKESVKKNPNKIVEDIIENMNAIIEKRAGKYDYEVADVYQSSVISHLQKDGVHPDSQGQQIIADLVCKEYEK